MSLLDKILFALLVPGSIGTSALWAYTSADWAAWAFFVDLALAAVILVAWVAWGGDVLRQDQEGRRA